jgi:hypothetical protein
MNRNEILGIGNVLNITSKVNAKQIEEDLFGRKSTGGSTINREEIYKRMNSENNDFRQKYGFDLDVDDLKSVASARKEIPRKYEPPKESKKHSSRTRHSHRKESSSEESSEESGSEGSGSESESESGSRSESGEESGEESTDTTSESINSVGSRRRKSFRPTPLFTDTSSEKKHRHSSRSKHEQRYKLDIAPRAVDITGVIDEMHDANLRKFETNRDDLLQRINALMAELRLMDYKIDLDVPLGEMTTQQLEITYKRLTAVRANKRNRSLVEALMINMSKGVEYMCDGKTMYFNKVKPDMTGASNIVRSKLRDLKFETGEVASDIFGGTSFSPWVIMAIELGMPLAMLHIENTKKKEHESSMSSTINDIEDMRRK